MLLPSEEKEYFESFIDYTEQNRGHRIHIGSARKGLIYLVLFGEMYPHIGSHTTDEICNRMRCYGCHAFESKRCLKFVKNNSPSKDVKGLLSNSKKYFPDKIFWEGIRNNFKEGSSDYLTLCKIVGEYRVKLFKQYMHNKAKKSIENYNKKVWSAKHKFDSYPDKEYLPNYCTAEYIGNNDKWLQFKAVNEEEDFLCSVLSGF